MQQVSVNTAINFPVWVPEAARLYLAHTSQGVPLRELARSAGMHASTVLRQVRRQENKRDDPLVDAALSDIEQELFSESIGDHGFQEPPKMSSVPFVNEVKSNPRIVYEAKRILRRLCETGAFLAVAPNMEKAVVFRQAGGNPLNKTAVVDKDIANKFALNDWIAGRRTGRVGRYTITHAGRAALSRMLAAETEMRLHNKGFGGALNTFRAQHQVNGVRLVVTRDELLPQEVRCNFAESPVTALGRRKGLNGMPFLSDDMVAAGERLREDFEIAQLGPKVAQNWDRFLTVSTRHGYVSTGGEDKPSAARDRVAAALAELGPGLADVAFRCCCFLEGLETAEKRLSWSARSGKVVLRIALGRLAVHYGMIRTSEMKMAC